MEIRDYDPFALKGNAWNPNTMGRTEFNKLKASLKRLGAFKPIIVRFVGTHYEILAGFHRNEAAKELGWTKVPGIDLGTIDDEKAKEISLVDNVRFGHDDEELMAKLLAEMDDVSILDSFIPKEDLPEITGDALADIRMVMEPEPIIKEPTEEKDELFKTLKYKLEIDKAEEIEAVLANVVAVMDFKHLDGYPDYPQALYYLLVMKKS